MGRNREVPSKMKKGKPSTVLMYDVYFSYYRKRQTEKIAILTERRSDPLRQDGLGWARRLFGKMVRHGHGIFIPPRGEVRIG